MTPCPGNLLPPRVHYPERMASDPRDNHLRNRSDAVPNARPSRLRSATIALAHESRDGCERGDRWTDGVPVWACRAEASRLPIQPENHVGRLTQMQDKTITFGAARVPGSGCAKLRKTGAQTPPEPVQTGAKAAPGRPLLTGTEPGPLPARGHAVGLFRREPEDRVGRLTQVRDEPITSVAARVSGWGCAKLRKTGRKPREHPRQREPRRPRVDPSRGGRNRARCRLGARRTDFFAASPRMGHPLNANTR